MDTPITPPPSEASAKAGAEPTRKNQPPVGRRWRPGQSGNPAGRPRRGSGAPGAPAAVERALKGLVSVEIDGRPRRLPATEALARAMLDRALAGDTAARRDLLKIQAELEAARAARRDAAREAREERARLAAEAAERAAEAADTEPTFPPDWGLEEILDVLEKWKIIVRRRGRFHLRQWVVDQAIFNGPAADEDDPWAWRALVDGVGERRSMRETWDMLEAVKAGAVSVEAAERWRPGRNIDWEGGLPYGAAETAAVAGGESVEAGAEGPEGWEDDEQEEDAGESGGLAAPPPCPPAASPAAAPAATPAREEDFIDRLCRRGGVATGGDWRG